MSDDEGTLGDRIRARRAARDESLTAELKHHIDEHFAALHARLDELEKNRQP
jgi:hypothetical protein